MAIKKDEVWTRENIPGVENRILQHLMAALESLGLGRVDRLARAEQARQQNLKSPEPKYTQQPANPKKP